MNHFANVFRLRMLIKSNFFIKFTFITSSPKKTVKDKILFWLDKGLVYYGIAYFLNQQYDCELFSIIETGGKTKEFYKNQKLIPFKKIWYFDDYVIAQNKEPDMKYLSSIEKKYGINIWLIAYAERFFNERSRYHKYTKNEILSLFESELRFYEQVLDEINPNFIVIRDVDMHHVNLFHQICKSRKIKILSLFPVRMNSKWVVSDTDKMTYDPMDLKRIPKSQRSFDQLRNYLKEHDQANWVKGWVTSSKINFFDSKVLHSIFYEFFLKGKAEREKFMSLERTRTKVFFSSLSLILKRKYRYSFLTRYSKKEIKNNEKFIFFPLHVSPERYVDISAPFFSNQLEVIANIAKSLPPEYKLYVKEHFAMKPLYWRKTSFYRGILALPNVELIHPSVSPEEIIKKSSLVIAITGTSALQAAFYEKPSIVLAHNIFKEFLPSIHRVKNLEELPNAIRVALKTKVNLIDLNRFVGIIEKECFDYNTHIFNNKSNPIFKTLFSDVNISESEMKTFLNHNSKTFEVLASEHLKKIKQDHPKYTTVPNTK